MASGEGKRSEEPAVSVPREPIGVRLRRTAQNLIAPGLALFAFFLIWEFVVFWFDIQVFILPAPSKILATIYFDHALLLKHLTFTVQNILIGFGLALVVSQVLGFLVAHFRIINRAIYPLLVGSQTIPVIAIAPVFIIWFGYGILPKVIITALICFFPLTVNTVTGYASVDPEMRTLFRVYKAGWWQTFWKLSVPSALPYIMAGVKISVTLSVIGEVIGEWIGSDRGLGYLVQQAGFQVMTPRLFAGLAFLAVIGVILFLIATLIERLLIPWRRDQGE